LEEKYLSMQVTAVAVAGDLRDARSLAVQKNGRDGDSHGFAEDLKCREDLVGGMEGSGTASAASSDEDSARGASGCSTPERSGW
jgi:hypothetical protein